MSEILNKMDLSANLTADQRYLNALKYDRLKSLEEQLLVSLRDVNKDAISIINKEMSEIYRINYNDLATQLPEGIVPIINKGSISQVLSKQVTPFKQLAIDSLKDSSRIRLQLSRELLDGIMLGDSTPRIAARIRKIMESNLSDSIRIARTEATRVENSARLSVGLAGKEKGFVMYKRWVSTNDDRTRLEHKQADGQVVEIDKPFIVGGEELMFPADESGSAGNVINCRCTIVNIIKEK